MTGTAEEIAIFLMRQEDRTKLFDIVEHKEAARHRSLDSNSYFWVIVNKIAKVQGISDTDVHDHLLRDNREYMFNETGAIDWKVSPLEPNKYGLLKEHVNDGYEYYIDSGMRVALHRETGEAIKGKKGDQIGGRVYWHIKGTRQMDVREMSRILDAALFEAKQLDIEIATPKQLSEMAALWGEKYAQAHKSLRDNSAGKERG